MSAPVQGSFGQLLRRYRLAAGYSQERLAELSGLGVHTIADLERGVSQFPHLHTVEALAEALHLSGSLRASFMSAARRPGVSAPQDQATAVERGVPIFVGRANELASGARFLGGEGSSVLLFAGEPGIGKSRLLRELAVQARGVGWRVVAGGCDQRSGREPYSPFVEFLAQLVLATPRAQRASDLRDCRWLAHLVPEIAEVAPAPVSEWSHDSGQERRLMFLAVRRYLDNIAGPAGTVLLLDDLHWAGVDALDLLAFLAHTSAQSWTAAAPPAARLRIVGAYRSSEISSGHPLDDLLIHLAQQERIEMCALDRFTTAEARALLSSLETPHAGLAQLETDEWAEEIIARADGVPFYLVTFAHELRPDGDAMLHAGVGGKSAVQGGIPWLVTAQIRQRVIALPSEGQEALAAAAIIGRVAPLSLLHTTLASAEDVVVTALEAACRARLLEDAGGTTVAYQFTHDLIRETILESLGRARRALLHRTVADALERLPAPERERQVAALAYHFARTDQWERAVQYSMQAAERAHDAGARREEATLLAQALDAAVHFSDSILVTDLHEKRGKALIAAALWVDGMHEFEAALRSLAGEQTEKRIAILLALANGCYFCESEIPDATQRARAYATEALLLAEGLERDDLAARAISEMAIYDTNDGLVRESQALFERAFTRAGTYRTALLLPALDQYGLNCYYLGTFAEADRYTRHALDIARTMRDSQITVRTLGNLGMTLTSSGRYDEALVIFAEARRLGHEFGTWAWLARAISMCAGLYLAVGDYDTAESVTEEARQVNQIVQFPNVTASTGVDLLLTYARRHDPDRAVGLLPGVEAAVAKTVASHHWLLSMRLAQAQAEVALACGAPEEAMRYAQDGIAQARKRGRVKYETLGLQTHAQALHMLGRTKEAIAMLRAAIERARPVGDPAMFLRAAAALLAIDGDNTLLGEAWETVERMAAAMPDELREVFLDAEPARLIAHLRQCSWRP